MMFTRLYVGVVLVGCVMMMGPATAQERTAAGEFNNQVTSSGITDKLNVSRGKSDVLNIRMDQAILCGKKNKLYAPGAVEADADGCVFSALSPSDTNTLNNMTLCALKGAVYSVSTNSCIYPGKERWYYEATAGGPPAGVPNCSGNAGKVARLCDMAGKACYVVNSKNVVVPRTCYSRGGDSSDYCTGGGSYTTRTYDVYRCE